MMEGVSSEVLVLGAGAAGIRASNAACNGDADVGGRILAESRRFRVLETQILKGIEWRLYMSKRLFKGG
jgi:hypothetical protein